MQCVYNEILPLTEVKYEIYFFNFLPLNVFYRNNSDYTITVTMKKFRNFREATHSFSHLKMISAMKKHKWLWNSTI